MGDVDVLIGAIELERAAEATEEPGWSVDQRADVVADGIQRGGAGGFVEFPPTDEIGGDGGRCVGERRIEHGQEEGVGRGRRPIGDGQADEAAAGGIRRGDDADGARAAKAAEHDGGDERRVGGAGGDGERPHRVVHVADLKREVRRGLVDDAGLAGDRAGEGRVIHRIDREQEGIRGAGGNGVGVGHGERDDRGAELVGQRRERERAIAAGATQQQGGVGDQRGIRRGRDQVQQGTGRLEVADDDWDRPQPDIFGDGLVAQDRDGGEAVRRHRDHRVEERTGGGEESVAEEDGDGRGALLVLQRREPDGAIGARAAEHEAGVGHEGRVRGEGAEGQAFDRRVRVANGEGHLGVDRVGVVGLVGNGRDERRVVDRVDRELKRSGSEGHAVVGDDDHGALSGLIRRRREDHGAIGPAAAEEDARAWQQLRVGGGGAQRDGTHRRVGVRQGDRDEGR